MAIDTTQVYSGPVTSVTVGATNLGGTYDGVEISREDEFSELHVDQIKGPISRKLMSRKFIVNLNCAELSLANLEIALGQESGNLTSSSLKLDDDDQAATTLTIVVPAPTGVGTRTYSFDTVQNVGGGGSSYKKDGTQTFIPVTFDCIGDANGEFGCIVDAE